ncbi:MAG: hypothetical protein ACYCZW_01980 [Minisyncoccota bacterium]
MTKKTLKISAYILLALAIALLSYYFMLSTNSNVVDGKKPFFGNLFPFGNTNTPIAEETPFATTTPEIVPDQQITTFEQVVRLISNEPVAGSTFIPVEKGDMIRYIEKATGHIFDVPSFENTNTRVSNTTIPQIYQASFTENGSGFIAQYTKDGDNIETFYGKLTGDTQEKAVVGSILSPYITNIIVSPDGKNIFTLEKKSSGSEGYISTPDGKNKKLIWSSVLKEFIPQFISNTHVGLQSKPHSSAFGVLFDINTTNASNQILISNQTNLTTLPYINKPYILYSNNDGLYTLETRSGLVTELSPQTFPEKCVWANNKVYIYCAVPKSNISAGSLYAWYRGELQYSDDVWEYNIQENNARRVVDLEKLAGRSIDISNISINKNDSLLLIQSKTDGSLWTIKIN